MRRAFPLTSTQSINHSQGGIARMHSLEDGQTVHGLLGHWEQLILLSQNSGLGRKPVTSPCLSSCCFSCLSPCQEDAAGTALSCQLCLAISSSSSWHEASCHPSATTHPAHTLPPSSLVSYFLDLTSHLIYPQHPEPHCLSKPALICTKEHKKKRAKKSPVS